MHLVHTHAYHHLNSILLTPLHVSLRTENRSCKRQALPPHFFEWGTLKPTPASLSPRRPARRWRRRSLSRRPAWPQRLPAPGHSVEQRLVILLVILLYTGIQYVISAVSDSKKQKFRACGAQISKKSRLRRLVWTKNAPRSTPKKMHPH